MWRKIAVMVLSVGFLGALTKAPIPEAKVDNSQGRAIAHRIVNTTKDVNCVYTDSARNQYTFWTQVQDPIKLYGDTVLLVFRGYEVDGSGFIAAAGSVDGGNTWVVARRLNEATGTFDVGGRYPSAEVAGGLPVAAFPERVSGPEWGHAVDLTGDWSGDPNNWYGESSGDVDVHKNVPIRCPDGTHVISLLNSLSGFMYAVYNVTDGYFEVPPTSVDPDFSLSGGDIYNGVVYAFGFSNSLGSLAYYTYDCNAGQWVGPQPLHDIPVEQLPDGEVLNTIMWDDGAVLADGTPVMVADIADGAGVDTLANYLLSRSVWLVTPDTAYQVLAPATDAVAHVIYSQVAVDRETGAILVFWNQLDTFYGDTVYGFGTWDIYYSYSLDGGATWSTPASLTNTPGSNEGMFQVSKRAYAVGNSERVAYAYLKGFPTASHPDIDVFWIVVSDFAGGVWPSYVHVCLADIATSVEEHSVHSALANAKVLGNRVEFSLPKAGDVSVAIYNVAGQKVYEHTYNLTAGTHSITLPSLTSGLYLVNLKAGDALKTLKYVRF